MDSAESWLTWSQRIVHQVREGSFEDELTATKGEGLSVGTDVLVGIKGVVYTVPGTDFYLEFHVLELFLFVKRMKILTKGEIHCISRSSLVTFISCAGTHWSN